MVTTPQQSTRVEDTAAMLAAEFSGIFSFETIQRAAQETAVGFEGSRVIEFVPLLTYRLTREKLRAQARVEGDGLMAKGRPSILFVCVHNAGRSQMAAVLTQALSGGKVDVQSAGSAPADRLNPAVVVAMTEAGLDISQEFPKPLTDEAVEAADIVVTMGCGDACPVFPGKRYLDWEIEDPAGKEMDTVRAIRDDIRLRVEAILRELGVEVASMTVA